MHMLPTVKSYLKNTQAVKQIIFYCAFLTAAAVQSTILVTTLWNS